MEILLGADPETFLTLSGKFVSAHGLLPGTKEHPFEVDKGAIQVDGLALEFNIKPAKTPDEFNSNIETVLASMKEMVSKVDKDLKINFTPFAEFDVKYFKEEVPDAAKILGCDPDFESVVGSVKEMNKDLTNLPFRTAAGHIHIGWTKDEDPFNPVHFEDARYIAEYFRGRGYHPGSYRSLSAAERRRLEYYGNRGAFRPKPYGVELRQYSNLWVENEKSRKEAFTYIHKGVMSLYKR